jgi:alpha-tubulin suppressor-like RCC1 family protein
VLCFGDDSEGQLGDGTASATPQPTPTPVIGLPAAVAQLSVGWDHSCVRLAGEELWCWGKNDNGELGDGTGTDRATPVPVGR